MSFSPTAAHGGNASHFPAARQTPADLPAHADGRPEIAPDWAAAWTIETRYARLGAEYFTALPTHPLPDPVLAGFSPDAAALIGLDPAVAADPQFVALIAGNARLAGAQTLATVYSGHQFGVWAGQLGDGRAHVIAELGTPDGPWEIQLKGAGKTPYSRMGDGRAVLRSSIREFLCSEAMAALGVPTTRALAVVASPAPVIRETVETAAVVARLAPSFVRFGHFEHFASKRREDLLARLADDVIDRFYPACREAKEPVLALLDAVLERSAQMVARWQALGFCHGVMNTDNMSILGLTIDYGPFGFLDAFELGHVCNHSDEQGRYAYANQPQVVHWNLVRLAESLLPLLTRGDDTRRDAVVDALRTVLARFPDVYGAAMLAQARAKLGLDATAAGAGGDHALVAALYAVLDANRVDHTVFFRRLGDAQASGEVTALRDMFVDREAWDRWHADYARRIATETRPGAARASAMHAVNPKYILRRHLAEIAIRQAREGDFSEVETLRRVLSRPYDDQPEFEPYAALPPDWASQLHISCSS